jgi:acyl-[acyl-carrier-protein]-phospholipid O-acyltransferase / long-chain-fatty-acid--[acyl-carrier-protein] ligase
MTKSGSYREVLGIPGIQPFLWTQFLNAFNDNLYKITVSLLAVSILGSAHRAGTYLSLAGFIFVAPFLLFSSYAGQLADSFEKRSVVVVTKIFEIAAMGLAFAALRSGRVNWMLAVLFFSATQAAIFSPAKYGIVPELVGERHITRTNGLLEMSTFVAVILGTIGGSFLVDCWKQQPGNIGLTLIAIAVMGTVVSFRIGKTPAPAHRHPFSWNPIGDVTTGIVRVKQDRSLRLTVLGTTYFWFLGALFQMLVLLFGKETLHCGEAQTGLLVASLAIGIGIGSMAAGRLSGEKIEPGLIPIGGAGMALGSFVLAFGAHNLVFAGLILAFIGFMGGLFIVPLNAILQHRPHANEKGRVIATANVVNTVGIMLASGVVWLLDEILRLTAAEVIGVSAVLTLLISFYALELVPDFTLRFTLWFLTRIVYRIRLTGKENIPHHGPALLVSNHVSYVDGFLISACIQRFVRFMVDEQWYDRFAKLFSFSHAIRVPSGGRRAIVKAIELAREELKRGHVVCIFAEGTLTRTGNLGEFHRGLERIVEGLDVPVIPIHLGGLWGSIFSHDHRASLVRSLCRLPFPVSVSFGRAMIAPGTQQVREAVEEMGADAAGDAIQPVDSLPRRFVRTAKRNWRHRAITDSSGRTLSYGQTLAAAVLVSRNFERAHSDEQMIGVMLPASVAAAVVNLGIALSGRVPVNLNFTVGREALESAIEQSSLRTIYTSAQFLAKAKMERRSEMRLVEDVFCFGKIEKLGAFIAGLVLPFRFFGACRARADDLAAILFSSGSTGTPKGVMLSHRNIIANVDSATQLFQINRAQTLTGVLPFFHCFGFTFTFWLPLLNGASAAYHPQPLDAKGVGQLVERAKATFLLGPPAFCQAYLRGCSKEQFASLRYAIVGAEKLHASLAQAFEEKFGLPLLEGYGATEMSPVIAVNVIERNDPKAPGSGVRAGTVGKPVPGIAAKVVNPETGKPARHGEQGLLLVRGPNRMMGYLNRPAETAAVLREGWYVTGDIVTIDDEGFIRIVDRQSRFSKIAGEMVPHCKIEETLRSLLPDGAAVVTSVPDVRKGERIVAFVAGVGITPQEVWQRLMGSGLPKIWVPKADEIHIVESLPMLGTGKIDLGAIKRLALAASSNVEGSMAT